MSGWRDMVANLRQADPEPAAATEAAARPHSDDLASLRGMAKPPVASDARWSEIVADAESLVVRWGDCLAEVGWSTADLFGFDLSDQNPDIGLVFAIRGGRVVLVDDRTAIIRGPAGGATRIHYRRPNPPPPIWHPRRRHEPLPS